MIPVRETRQDSGNAAAFRADSSQHRGGLPTGEGSSLPSPAAGGPAEKEAEEIVRLRLEIQTARSDLDRYIGELDLRRHEILDLKVQARKHPAIVVGIGLAILAAAGGAVALVRRARRREPLRKPRRARSGLASVRVPAPLLAARVARALARSALPLGMALAKGVLRRREGRRPRPA
jgi:hypothetical protein